MCPDYEFIVLEDLRKPNVYAISSNCETGDHVIFWDFDITHGAKAQHKLESALKNIQRQFLLSKIYIFETRCGYNAICLDKLDKNTVANIKNLTPYDDRKHLEHGLMNGWKMRIGSDKKFISTIHVPITYHNTLSNPHRIALNNFFGCKIDYNNYFDKSKELQLYSYWDWKIANGNGETIHEGRKPKQYNILRLDNRI